jgi:MutS domain I
MAQAGKPPELTVEDKGKAGFVSWFKKLEAQNAQVHLHDQCHTHACDHGMTDGGGGQRVLHVCNRYRHLELQDNHVVRFFDHKTFLTVHGDDAILIAQQYYRTADVIKHYTAGAAQLPGTVAGCCYTYSDLRDQHPAHGTAYSSARTASATMQHRS